MKTYRTYGMVTLNELKRVARFVSNSWASCLVIVRKGIDRRTSLALYTYEMPKSALMRRWTNQFVVLFWQPATVLCVEWFRLSYCGLIKFFFFFVRHNTTRRQITRMTELHTVKDVDDSYAVSVRYTRVTDGLSGRQTAGQRSTANIAFRIASRGKKNL